MNRRWYLSMAGAGIVGSLSGCSGSSDPGDENEDPSVNSSNTEPKKEAEFTISESSIPDRVTQPDPLEISITIENTSQVDGEISESASFFTESDYLDVPLSARTIDLSIPAGETATWEFSENITGSGIVEFSYRDLSVEITVEPESRAPRISQAELITGWESYGDVIGNAVDELPAENAGVVGFRYDYWHEGGTHDITYEVVIRNEMGTQEYVFQNSWERLTDRQGWGSWEAYTREFPNDAEPGEYEATIYLRNDETDEVSDSVTTEFELT